MQIDPSLPFSTQSVNTHTIEDAMEEALVTETGVTTTITAAAVAVVETITATEGVEIWVEETTKEEITTAVADMAGAIIIIIDTTHKATTMEMAEVTTEEEVGIMIANELIETIGMVVGEWAMTTTAAVTIISTTTITTITTIITG